MELANVLSPAETVRLVELEGVIKDDIKGFIRVGMALKEIRDKRLYRGRYTTWKDYLKGEWDLSKGYAHRQISAYDVVENLKQLNEMTPMSDDERLPIGNLLKNEAQVRPLTLLETPEQQLYAWKEALSRNGGKPTALAVLKVVMEILEAKKDLEKAGIQKRIVKEVSVPDEFSVQLNKLLEVMALYRKAGWKEFNRKKALEYVDAIKNYLNS